MARPALRRLVALLCLALLLLLPSPAGAGELDFDLPDGSGHFYKQANGLGGAGETGFAVTNDDGIPFWDAYRQSGGPLVLGYPVTGRFLYDGFVTQAMQKAVFQWRPEVGQVWFLNSFDALHDRGKDDWLLVYRQTPKPFDTSPDNGLAWDQVVKRHQTFLDQNQAIKKLYFADPYPIDHFGLPVAYADEGNSFVIRAQRATFQFWKEDVPWARAGVRSFDFDQEHGFGRLYGLPNYEVNYKPWVREIVSSLADSRALMGWQLGNELKARGSPRNGISSDQAYEWYLAFTRDMVDTIRSLDRNHLIFMGAQYVAELVDWEYRPDGRLQQDRIPEYRELVQRMLDARGSYTWNVWSLTSYDFNPYALDDAAAFGRAGVAVVATEYGFTRGTEAEMQARYGGDRPAAVRSGLDRRWQELEGRTQPREWGVPELFARGLLDGMAPWGSSAPGPGAELDGDGQRGITGTPDEGPLWAAWGEVTASLEEANRSATPLR